MRLISVDYGDVGYYVGANTTKVMLEETYENAKKIFASGSKLLTFGGDHTIPYGMVRAASEKFGKLALLHFDSHQDSTPSTDGNISHANFAYDLQAEGCIDPSTVCSGIYPYRNDRMWLQYYSMLRMQYLWI